MSSTTTTTGGASSSSSSSRHTTRSVTVAQQHNNKTARNPSSSRIHPAHPHPQPRSRSRHSVPPIAHFPVAPARTHHHHPHHQQQQQQQQRGIEIIELSSDNELDPGGRGERPGAGAMKRKRDQRPAKQAPPVTRARVEPAALSAQQQGHGEAKQDQSALVESLRKELERVTKARDHYKEKLEVASKSHASSSKRKSTAGNLDLSELDDAISCEICTMKMYSPATLSECGHTFCSKCLFDWFNTTFARHVEAHPMFLQRPQIPPALLRQNPQVAAQYARFEAMWNTRVPDPEYTCPTCRVQIKKQPMQLYLLKDLVGKIAKISGEEEDAREGSRKMGWDGFFPSK